MPSEGRVRCSVFAVLCGCGHNICKILINIRAFGAHHPIGLPRLLSLGPAHVIGTRDSSPGTGLSSHLIGRLLPDPAELAAPQTELAVLRGEVITIKDAPAAEARRKALVEADLAWRGAETRPPR